MGRVRSPVCRLCKREGAKLYLKGSRCESQKCPLNKKKREKKFYRKGRRFIKFSEYKMQLREKAKVRTFYGIGEAQFKRYFQIAKGMGGIVGEKFLQILETRLDNVLYLAQFLPSRRSCRQLISHGGLLINGRRLTIPSALIKQGDEVKIKPNSKFYPKIKAELSLKKEKLPEIAWLEIKRDDLSVKILREPRRDEVSLAIQEQQIVSLYLK